MKVSNSNKSVKYSQKIRTIDTKNTAFVLQTSQCIRSDSYSRLKSKGWSISSFLEQFLNHNWPQLLDLQRHCNLEDETTVWWLWRETKNWLTYVNFYYFLPQCLRQSWTKQFPEKMPFDLTRFKNFKAIFFQIFHLCHLWQIFKES